MKAHALLSSLLLLSLSGLSTGALADEDKKDPMAHGEKVHQTHCYKCHTDQVYTRENRFVRSLDALSKQVKRCKENTGAPWFEEDTDAVVQFLNKKYYKF
ncbi:MAG TPA: cytochrome c [Gammaproteobacteria bacterium]|nr:cytochrome c [Gammaproteobacteria bacterium]